MNPLLSPAAFAPRRCPTLFPIATSPPFSPPSAPPPLPAAGARGPGGGGRPAAGAPRTGGGGLPALHARAAPWSGATGPWGRAEGLHGGAQICVARRLLTARAGTDAADRARRATTTVASPSPQPRPTPAAATGPEKMGLRAAARSTRARRHGARSTRAEGGGMRRGEARRRRDRPGRRDANASEERGSAFFHRLSPLTHFASLVCLCCW